MAEQTKSIFQQINPRKYRLIGFDTETHLITESDPIPPLVCISLAKLHICMEELSSLNLKVRAS